MENNQIQIFDNSEFGEIRTVVIDGEPWFVARDISDSLGYQQTNNMIKMIDKDDSRYIDPQKPEFTRILQNGVSPFASNIHNIIVINESGLFKAIFGSKLPNAKKFTKWVTSEVLPTIHRTGGYGTAQLPMTTEGQIKLLAQGHGELKEEIREVKSELDKFKEELPLLPVEMQEITEAVHKKGVSVMGGKKSPAYHDRSISQSVYRDIYNEIHRNFDCFTYKAIPRKYLSKVLDVVEKYALPVVLSDRISDANNQLSFM